MTLVHISDTHGKHSQLDLKGYSSSSTLIHTGDWTGGSDIAFSETDEFLTWLEALPFKHKILIAGNHERNVEANREYFKTKVLPTYPSITYLEDSGVTLDGIKFYGSPYSNEFCNWAFMEEENGLAPIWDKIPLDTQVLLTHGPAYECHDKVKHAYGRDPHVGSKSLTKRKLVLTELKVHCSGHIHEAYGDYAVKGVINSCASILDENYNRVNNPITVEI